MLKLNYSFNNCKVDNSNNICGKILPSSTHDRHTYLLVPVVSSHISNFTSKYLNPHRKNHHLIVICVLDILSKIVTPIYGESYEITKYFQIDPHYGKYAENYVPFENFHRKYIAQTSSLKQKHCSRATYLRKSHRTIL